MAALRLCSSLLSSGVLPHFYRQKDLLTKAETVIAIPRRWKKRRWAPIAASKLFIVRERTPIDPDEYKELKVRYDHYRTTVRSIRDYFKEELLAKTAALTDQSHVEQETKHLAWCLSENDTWNKQSAEFRDSREIIVETEKEELELKQLIEMEEQEKERHEKHRLQVLKTKDESKKFVSPENLEDIIETALNQRSVYNFAIDTEGRRFIEQTDGRTVIENLGIDADEEKDSQAEIAESKTAQTEKT